MSASLILCNNNEPFLNQIVMCNEKWILYNNQWWPAQWSEWEEAPKHFPKPNLHQEKVMVTVWWSAAGLIHDSFLNPSETIGKSEKYAQRTDEMHRKPENLNACSQHWPIERAQFFSRQCPTTCRTANKSTGEWIERQSFASSSICAQLCPTLQSHGRWPARHLCPWIFQVRILKWVAISYSRGSSGLRDWTLVSCGSCIAGRFFTRWATREAPLCNHKGP